MTAGAAGRRVALIGDIHGCIRELEELYRKLTHLSIDEVFHVGDLVDRGPDSGAVIDFCIRNKINGVMGNHEDSILNLWARYKKDGFLPKSPDKSRTISQLNAERVKYLSALPKLHVFDDLNTLIVHGGVWPHLPLYAQPLNVIRAQMINTDTCNLGRSRWWGVNAAKSEHQKTEAESYLEGWRRWYELYDGHQNVVFGHSVFRNPFTHKNEGTGTVYGIDQGGCFGGYLTALIIPDMTYVQVRARRAYVGRVFDD